MENFANFLFLFNQDTRRLISNIENIENKLINCQLAVVFNETCLNIYVCLQEHLMVLLPYEAKVICSIR